MKRSEINGAIRFTEKLLDSICFKLPEFGYWEPVQRFSDIEEDQKPFRLLCNEYERLT